MTPGKQIRIMRWVAVASVCVIVGSLVIIVVQLSLGGGVPWFSFVTAIGSAITLGSAVSTTRAIQPRRND